jgi:hypothetical protein
LNGPAKIAAHWVGPIGQPPTGFTVAVTPNTKISLPYYPLHEYRLVWRIVDEKGKTIVVGDRAFAELTDTAQLAGSLAIGPQEQRVRLIAMLLSPTGLVAAQETLEWLNERGLQ